MRSMDGIRTEIVRGTAAAGRKRGAAAAAWAAPDVETAAAAAPAGICPVGLSDLLQVQEWEGDAGADRRARTHGQELLGRLAGLQVATLGGEVPDAELSRLAHLCDCMPRAASPGLQSILESIGLRARIELQRRVNNA